MGAGTPDTGLAASLRRLVGTLLEVAEVRLQLLSTEFESEKLRLFDVLVWLVLALMCATTGLLLAIAYVVMLLPESMRAAAVGVAAASFIAAAVAFALHARRRLDNPSGPVSATVDELRLDRKVLKTDD